MRDRNRWIALVVLCTGMLMIVLDGSTLVHFPTSVDIGAGQLAATS